MDSRAGGKDIAIWARGAVKKDTVLALRNPSFDYRIL
jgi:hypothetical protein